MRRLNVLGVVWACCLCMASCSGMAPYADMARTQGISDEYARALHVWTRGDAAYSEFETRAIVKATRRGPSFEQAYAREYARLFDATAQERAQGERIRQGLAGDFLEFFAYVYVPEKEHNDLDRRGASWTVYLLDARGKRTDPVEIRRYRQVTPVMQVFFPFANPYHGVCYSLKFPAGTAPEGGGEIRLVFAGIHGKVELVWQNPS